jgi:hypothetical protein
LANIDWISLALTVVGVGGLLLGSRMLKPRLKLPAVSPWLPMGIYNGFWAVILLIDYFTALSLPAVVAPIAIAGGNGVLINFFGLPTINRAPRPHPKKKEKKDAKKGGTGVRSTDPDRQPLVLRSKKKKKRPVRR